MRMIRSVSYLLIFLISIPFSLAQAAPLCPLPKIGLQAGQQNTHGEALSFSYQSTSYPVDLFSGYARRSDATIDYCLRYEAINKGSNAVERFYWPLASNLEIKSLAPRARSSILVTAKSENPPGIAQTKVYAFAREQVSSRAYKADGQQVDASAAPPGRSAPAQDWIERLALKESAKFPEIGTQYSDGSVEVTASSSANWDGKTLALAVSVSTNDGKLVANLRAPVAWAIIKGITDAKEFVSAARSLARQPLPLTTNEFKYQPKINSARPELFLIRSPIAFSGPGGRVCFVAATYSPVRLLSEAAPNCDSLE